MGSVPAVRALQPDDLADAAHRLRAQGYRCSPLPPYWVPPSTAAAILLRSDRALKAWRAEGKGPTPHTLDGRCCYRLDDVLAYRRGATTAEW